MGSVRTSIFGGPRPLPADRRAEGSYTLNCEEPDFTRSIQATAAKHQRIRLHTPKHNGKVERYNRNLAEEILYAREWTSEAQRADAMTVWNIHYNYHRAHTAAGDQPPASRLRASVTNVMTRNS